MPKLLAMQSCALPPRYRCDNVGVDKKINNASERAPRQIRKTKHNVGVGLGSHNVGVAMLNDTKEPRNNTDNRFATRPKNMPYEEHAMTQITERLISALPEPQSLGL